MTARRGEVVLVNFPFASGTGSKVRPALVIQNDADNARLTNTILAQITGTTQRAGEPIQMLVEVATPEGQQTGLKFDSVVNCVNLATVSQGMIVRALGTLPPRLMLRVQDALKVALALP
jgi:mRNA interferase MazF